MKRSFFKNFSAARAIGGTVYPPPTPQRVGPLKLAIKILIRPWKKSYTPYFLAFSSSFLETYFEIFCDFLRNFIWRTNFLFVSYMSRQKIL